MRMRIKLSALIAFLILMMAPNVPAWADDGAGYNPLQQPRPQSPYGMDMMGPGWQWTFPREDGWPRLDTRIRVDLLDEMFQKAWAAGVRNVRISLWWCLTEPERDVYRWEDLDLAFQLASNYGLEITPQIFYTPDWAALGYDIEASCLDYQTYPRNLPPKNMDDWSDLMKALTKRYGASGKNQVHNWEIWNEPDLYEFWFVRPHPESDNVPRYAELVQRARGEVDRNDPGGRVLAGDVSDINGPEFLRRLMALRGEQDVRGDIDVISFHIFSNTEGKLRSLKSALGNNKFELWVTELNSANWNENVSLSQLQDLYGTLSREGVSRSFWFESWTSDWGPGIFTRSDPIWDRESFDPSPFYATFQQQALTERLPQAPILLTPQNAELTASRPIFSWQRPQAGDAPIVGYKLQVDDSLYRGRPYFHSPELDVWVPTALLHYLPLQIIGGAGAEQMHDNAISFPSADNISYQAKLPPGRYFWRVAAVDEKGNVGPYSAPRTLFVTVGEERVFLPTLTLP